MHGLRILQTRDHVADLANRQCVNRGLGRTLDAHAVDQKVTFCLHHTNGIALFNGAVKNTDRGNDAAVLIKIRVQDERLERRVCIALGR